ncbi:MAG: peptide ABC transporter substrate-binding protein [Pirellulales bacterium]
MIGRTSFLVVLFVASLAAISWAVYGSRLPPADFTFFNESEIKSVDPAIITGHPEGRIAWAIYEGLMRPRPEDNTAEPGVADHWDISDDGRVYTFHLRDNARWSNGEPVTAHDFHYAFRRLLDPMTGAEYAYQAWYIVNAKRYTYGAKRIEPGDPVEVELNPPPGAVNTVRGKLLLGKLIRIEDEAPNDPEAPKRVFVVDIDGQERRFKLAGQDETLPPGVEPCRQVLLDFREVGIRVIDDRTIEIRLASPTPYFLELLAFYPFSPIHQVSIERYGKPDWKRPEHLVTNGAFRLAERRIRDRIRLVRNDMYWDRDNVKLGVIDALSIEDRTTALNLFLTDECDWTTQPPAGAIRELLKSDPPRNDLNPYPQLATYFYLLNTTRPPLNDRRIRQALSLALDREEITRVATAAGEEPAFGLVPPNMPNYERQSCPPRDPDRARKLLADAGYPGGLGFPKLEIHYNTDQAHQSIAELARKQWQRELGITVTLRNEEWASAQESQQRMDFMLSRRSWIGDYLDPNTFLDMFLTGGENNNTGFSNAKYDRLIAGAAEEPDQKVRRQMLERAERILMDEMPIIPIYNYVSRNMVKPYVRGWYNNLQDSHHLRAIWIDPQVDLKDPHPNEFMGRKP